MSTTQETIKNSFITLVKKAQIDLKTTSSINRLIKLSELPEDKLLEEALKMSLYDKKSLNVALSRLQMTLSIINEHAIRDVPYANKKEHCPEQHS